MNINEKGIVKNGVLKTLKWLSVRRGKDRQGQL